MGHAPSLTSYDNPAAVACNTLFCVATDQRVPCRLCGRPQRRREEQAHFRSQLGLVLPGECTAARVGGPAACVACDLSVVHGVSVGSVVVHAVAGGLVYVRRGLCVGRGGGAEGVSLHLPYLHSMSSWLVGYPWLRVNQTLHLHHPRQGVASICSMLGAIQGWVANWPPMQQPMRFGNRAFRSWHGQLVAVSGCL